MANKSNPATQIISTPQGGGALHRIGEAFSPDLHTFELTPEEILGVPNGTAIGAEELDLSEIQDVVLSMEYDITLGGP